MNELKTGVDHALRADDQPETAAQPRNHGADVSAVAHAEDPTPETNHGADVSAAAKANHGHEGGKLAHPGKSHGHK